MIANHKTFLYTAIVLIAISHMPHTLCTKKNAGEIIKHVQFTDDTKAGIETTPTKIGYVDSERKAQLEKAPANDLDNCESPQDLLVRFLSEKSIISLSLFEKLFGSKEWRYRLSFFEPEELLNTMTPQEWIEEYAIATLCPWLIELMEHEKKILALYDNKYALLKKSNA